METTTSQITHKIDTPAKIANPFALTLHHSPLLALQLTFVPELHFASPDRRMPYRLQRLEATNSVQIPPSY
jgi:hypothetical protein